MKESKIKCECCDGTGLCTTDFTDDHSPCMNCNGSGFYKTPKREQGAVELLPCPFCGRSAAICHKENEGVFIVECEFCRSASRRRPAKILAIKAWNTRTPPTQSE